MSAALTGKVALITGASKGIGAAVAEELHSLGANVVINYSSDSALAEALVKKFGSDRAIAIKANAGSVPDIERLVKETVNKFGKIDILMPNAGILPMKDLASTTEADFDSIMNINVKGPYFLAQKAAPHIPSGGHIVFVSTSICALSTATPMYTLYCASKGAIEQITRLTAKDLGTKGINVNCIAPGPTGTELFLKGKSEQLVKQIASANPFQRLGTPKDIAKAVSFLAGDGSAWVNGQILRVNGGMTIGPN